MQKEKEKVKPEIDAEALARVISRPTPKKRE